MSKSLTTIYLDHKIIEEYQRRAKEQDRTQTYLMTQALTYYLENDKFAKLLTEKECLQDEIKELENRLSQVADVMNFKESEKSKTLEKEEDFWSTERNNYRELKKQYDNGTYKLSIRYKRLINDGKIKISFEEYQKNIGALND